MDSNDELVARQLLKESGRKRFRRQLLQEIEDLEPSSSLKPFVDYTTLPGVKDCPTDFVRGQLEILESENRVELKHVIAATGPVDSAVRLTGTGRKSLEVEEDVWQLGHRPAVSTTTLNIQGSQIGSVSQVSGAHHVGVQQLSLAEKKAAIAPPAAVPSSDAVRRRAMRFPICDTDWGIFVRQLRNEGFDAQDDLYNGQRGLIVGPKGLDPNRMPPNMTGLFFPSWELNYDANRPFVEARKFHDIIENRRPNWQFNRPYREQEGVRQPVSPPTQSEIRLVGPHDVDLILEAFHGPQGKHGVLIRLHNRRIANLANCTVIVRHIRSFDAVKQSLREGAGFKSIRVLKQSFAAGFESSNVWLIRIETDHLEIGDTISQGEMCWPTGDRNDKQRWRLFFSVTAEGLEEWVPEVDVEWVPHSDTIQLREVQPELRL